MPWPPDSGFPEAIQIGQGTVPGYATELDVDHPMTSDQHKRLRDRDEYLKSMLSDGAAAPEILNVKGIIVAGSITPVYHLKGLLAANGWDSPGAGQYITFRDIFRIILNPTIVQHCFVSTQISIFDNAAGASIEAQILIDDILEGAARTTDAFSGPRDWATALSWAGSLSVGVHSIALQIRGPFVTARIAETPTMSILLT